MATLLLSRHKVEVNGFRLGFEHDDPNAAFWGVRDFDGLGPSGLSFSSGQRQQADGTWRTTGYLPGLSIAVSGFCYFGNLHQMRSLINDINVAVARTEVDVIYHHTDGTRRQTRAARDGSVGINVISDNQFDFSFTMVAEEPYWYYMLPITGQTGLPRPA